MSNPVWHLGAALLVASALAVVVPHERVRVSSIEGIGGPPDTLVVDGRASRATWSVGRGARRGVVGITSGLLVSRHEMLTTGRFAIDMSSLHDGQPAATFVTRGATRVGPARWRVSGDLTLHGISRPLTFDADVRWPELGHMVATSTFSVSRPDFGLTLGANAPAGDEIVVNVTLDARRKAPVVAVK